MGTERDVAHVLGMLTEHPARILGLRDYGLRGRPRRPRAVGDGASRRGGDNAWPGRLVVKAGRLSIEHGRSVSEPWRATT